MELNIYGNFAPGPWKTDAAILAAINSGKDDWFPSKVELKRFANSGRGVVEGADNVWNMLCSIVRHKPTRVNVCTHGTDGYIGFVGQVVKGNVIFDARKEENSLNPDIIEEAEKEGFKFSDHKTKNATMKDVRGALGKNAEMVLYACHSGLEQDYLKQIANLLRIKVWGFKSEILYHPVPTKDLKTIKTWQYSAGPTEKVTDFHKLQPDVVCFSNSCGDP
jgi:hypothetical protein